MSLFTQFKTNQDKELEGVPVSYAPNSDGTVPKFIISRMSKSNVRYTKALEIACRPYQRQIALDTLDPMVSDEVSMRVFVNAVLVGWENVQGSDGKPLEFTAENAMSLLKALPDLYDDLRNNANKASLFRDEELDAKAKN